MSPRQDGPRRAGCRPGGTEVRTDAGDAGLGAPAPTLRGAPRRCGGLPVDLATARRPAACVAQRIDLAARLGGDEFAVLLDACGLATAMNVAEQIRARVDAHSLVWQGAHFRVGVRIAVVRIDETYVDVAAVLAAADAACHAAKHAGRNRVRSGGPGPRLVRDGSP